MGFRGVPTSSPTSLNRHLDGRPLNMVGAFIFIDSGSGLRLYRGGLVSPLLPIDGSATARKRDSS